MLDYVTSSAYAQTYPQNMSGNCSGFWGPDEFGLDTWFWNDHMDETDPCYNSTGNSTQALLGQIGGYKLWTILLVLFPLCTIFGG